MNLRTRKAVDSFYWVCLFMKFFSGPIKATLGSVKNSTIVALVIALVLSNVLLITSKQYLSLAAGVLEALSMDGFLDHSLAQDNKRLRAENKKLQTRNKKLLAKTAQLKFRSEWLKKCELAKAC